MNLPGGGSPIRVTALMGVLGLRFVLCVDHQPSPHLNPAPFQGLLERGRGPIDTIALQCGPPAGRHLYDDSPNLVRVARAHRELDVGVPMDRIALLAVARFAASARD